MNKLMIDRSEPFFSIETANDCRTNCIQIKVVVISYSYTTF